MSKNLDLTHRLNRDPNKRWDALEMANQRPLGRKLAVDWFFRGMWILFALAIGGQVALGLFVG
jgi:hypothetical protein